MEALVPQKATSMLCAAERNGWAEQSWASLYSNISDDEPIGHRDGGL